MKLYILTAVILVGTGLYFYFRPPKETPLSDACIRDILRRSRRIPKEVWELE